MSAVFYILKELWALIVEDYVFSLANLIWIVVTAILNSLIRDETWRAPVFLTGLLAILLFSVATANRATAVSTRRERNKL
jgi:phosphate starvation-inducible membrane PsiE